MCPSHPPIQCVCVFFPRSKAAEALSRPINRNLMPALKMRVPCTSSRAMYLHYMDGTTVPLHFMLISSYQVHWGNVSVRFISGFIYLPLQTKYEGWNFNFGNAPVTFDTAHLQSSYFHRPSVYSPTLCRTRSQWWGSRMMPLAAPVLLMVQAEQSTAEGLNPPCNCPIW